MASERDDDTESLVLSDLVNRVLDKGAVITGHVIVSVANVDLLMVDLRLLLTSVQRALEHTPNNPNDDSSLLPRPNRDG